MYLTAEEAYMIMQCHIIIWLLQKTQMMKANQKMRMKVVKAMMMMSFNSWLDLLLTMVGVDRHVKHDQILTARLETQLRHPEPESLKKSTCTPCAAERLPANNMAMSA